MAADRLEKEQCHTLSSELDLRLNLEIEFNIKNGRTPRKSERVQDGEPEGSTFSSTSASARSSFMYS
jgi:hypothetical protein